MSQPLRIAVPIHSFEPGGVERVALNLAEAWQEAGDAVTVVLGRRDGAMAATAPELNYDVRPSPIPTAAWETLWMIWCLWRYLRRNAADVVFCSGNTYAVVAGAMKLLLGRRCPPMVLKVSNDLARRDMPAIGRPFYRFWLRLQGGFIDHFTGMAGPMREEICEAMRVGADRVSIIHDPSLTASQLTRLSAIPRTDGPRQVRNLLAIGRLAPQKNFPLLLRAFARWQAPEARLTILGEGPERGKIERLARELGVAGRIDLPGHCADTAPALAEAEAFVLSSDYEGVPAVVLEALAAGLPIVATDCSVSMPELLGQGKLGHLVPVGDEAGFARALDSVCDLAYSTGEARGSVRDYTIDIAAPGYRALFMLLTSKPVTEP